MGRLPKNKNSTASPASKGAAPKIDTVAETGTAPDIGTPPAGGKSLKTPKKSAPKIGRPPNAGRPSGADGLPGAGIPRETVKTRDEAAPIEEDVEGGLDALDEQALAAVESEAAGLTREQQNSEQNIEFERIFAEWKSSGDPRLRDRLILMHRNLVSYLARRFTDRGEMYEDIIQQGLLGLINALDHFEPAHGARFVTFATPTIVGEIRRYFRDRTATVRVPRRMMELHQLIHAKIEVLTQELNHSPTYAEIARALDIDVEEVIEALEVAHALDPVSLDDRMPPEMDGSSISIVDQLGANDPDLQAWSENAALNAALERLPLKQRQVLQYAYFDGFSQAEIARKLNVSQMHISRVQRRALASLREMLQEFDT